MLYDLSAVLPFTIAFVLLALAGATVALVATGRVLAEHHRIRVARHQSIPAYYRRVVLAH